MKNATYKALEKSGLSAQEIYNLGKADGIPELTEIALDKGATPPKSSRDDRPSFPC